MKHAPATTGALDTSQATLALLEKRERLLRIQQSSAEQLPADDKDLPLECADLEVEVCNAATETLTRIAAAQERIRAGAYGICENCGGRIPQARLEALPFTTHCIECQRQAEKMRVAEVITTRAEDDLPTEE